MSTAELCYFIDCVDITIVAYMKQNNMVMVNIGWPRHASTEPGTGIYVRFQLYSCLVAGGRLLIFFKNACI